MKSNLFRFVGLSFLGMLLVSCMVMPVSSSGGLGSRTVRNTSPEVIVAVAQDVFSKYGYSVGPTNFPNWVAFDKPSGAFGQLLYGGYMEKTTMRARLTISPIPGTGNYRLSVSVFRVNNAGEAGFEDQTGMMGLWSAEFSPILRQISDQATGSSRL